MKTPSTRTPFSRPRHTPRAHHLAFCLVLLPALCLTTLAAAQSGIRPGEDDPIQNPSRLTLFPDDEVFVPASANIATYFWEIDMEAVAGDLANWTVDTLQNTTSRCNYPARRVVSGHVSDPTRAEILCATNYRVDLLGPVPRSLTFPDAGVSQGRPVALTVADLDRIADANGIYHPEVVVAYKRLDGRVRLLVLNQRFETLAQIDGSAVERGDVELAGGDFDGDGRMELVLATGDSDARAYNPADYGRYPGKLTLQAYRYDGGPDGGTLTAGGTTTLDASGAFFSTTLAGGDFDGDSLDEIALASYNLASGSKLSLRIYKVTPQLTFQAKATADVGSPALASYAGLDAGLLKYDPRTGYSMDRRQLATVFADAAGNVRVSAWDVAADLAKLTPKHYDLPVKGALSEVGPAVSIGNFRGVDVANSPLSQIGVNVPVSAGGNRSYPHFYCLRTADDLALSVAFQRGFPEYESSAPLWSQELAAYDRDGNSLYLGAPIHIEVSNLVDPEYVILEPPKHVDYLPVDPTKPDGEHRVVDVSGNPSFYVQLTSENQQTLEKSSTDTTSWNIGGSAAFSSKSTVGGGFGDIASASVTTQFKTALSYDYNENTSETNSEYKQVTVREKETTNRDDQVRALVRLIDIWRYPVYGLDLVEPAEEQGYYEVMLPGPTRLQAGGGLTQEWYDPTHQNRNVLSYAPVGTTPPDLGSFTPGDGEPVTAPLNQPVTRYWDGNAQTLYLEWTERAGKEEKKEYSNTLKETVDVSIGTNAKVKLGIASAENETKFDFNFHNTNSWGGNEVSKQTISESTGIELNKPAAGDVNESYGFETLAYITANGYLKVTHNTDALASGAGRAWWLANYGQYPDPAVNLPNRFTNAAGKWELTPGGGGFYLRQVALRKVEVNPVTNTHDYFGNALASNDQVEVAASVYNFSLQKDTGPFDVLFQYAEVDPATNRVIGPRQDIGRVRTGLQPLERRQVAVTWNVSALGGSAPGQARYWRLFVIADPADELSEIQDGVDVDFNGPATSNNAGYWPWSSGVPVFFAQEETAASAALDVSMAADGLALVRDDGTLVSDLAAVQTGRLYHLRATFHANVEDRAYHHVAFTDSAGRTVAGRVVRGLVAGDNYVWADWVPEAPVGKLSVELFEGRDDPSPGDATDELEMRFSGE